MYKLFQFTAVPCDSASPVKPTNLIISANSKSEAIDNFLHGHQGHTYSSVKELVELSQKMIEGALDDDLDNMYEPYTCLATDEEIPASEIIKKFYLNTFIISKFFITFWANPNKFIIKIHSVTFITNNNVFFT